MPLFLETVSESELIVRKFPCAVHNIAAPIPTRTDPRYKAQTIGFRKDKIKTLIPSLLAKGDDPSVTVMNKEGSSPSHLWLAKINLAAGL